MLEKNASLLPSEICIAGRPQSMDVSGVHAVNGHSYLPPFPDGYESIVFAMGCFWGVERLFWQLPGVYVTAVGYAGGVTVNPTYDEVCSGHTNHTEVVLVVYDPSEISLADLLKIFWEEHDPTQVMRQGNDRGTQYRSAIYLGSDKELRMAESSRDVFQRSLSEAGFGDIATEIGRLDKFYYAEDYHQQYLHKVPHGYCSLAGTGVAY